MISKSDLDEVIGCELVGIKINPASVSMSFNRSGREGVDLHGILNHPTQ